MQLIHELIERQARITPKRTAAIWHDRRLTYRELMNQVGRLSGYLRLHGVGPESLVGVSLDRSLDLLIALIAVLDAGGAYLPLDLGFPTERIAFMLEDSGARALITHSALVSPFTQSAVPTVLVDCPDKWCGRGESVESAAPTPANLAYLMYTSGSTGIPKGVMVEHRNVVNFFRGMDDILGTVPGVWLALTSISFDISVLELLWTLARGYTVVIQGDEEKLTTGEHGIAEQIARHGVTHLQCTPTTAELLIRRPGMAESLKTLRKLLVGGEALPVTLADSLKRIVSGDVLNMYGPTETTIWSTSARVTGDEAVTIGRPIVNTHVYVIGEDGRECPPGEIGEIFIGGDGVARGYWHRPELTAERFITRQVAGREPERLYRTGDLGRYRANGDLEFHGRVDQQIKLRGYRIELGEIETVLGSHPAVAQVVVRPYVVAGNSQLAAYVVIEADRAVGQDELREFARRRLPDYMIPVVFLFLPSLPLTPNGKIDRQSLPPPDPPKLGAEEITAPRTVIEQTIANVFSDALGIPVGLGGNFLEMGATSVVIAQAAATLGERLNRPVKVADLFAHPTVRALALFLGSQRASDNTSERVAERRRAADCHESAKLKKTYGGEINSAANLETPIIGKLVRLIRNGATPAIKSAETEIEKPALERQPQPDIPHSRAQIIELRHGGPRSLFLVHDGEGETLLYLNLARRMPKNLGVYAIEPPNLARIPLAHATIEEMAAAYIDEIRHRQPHGPYQLAGLCVGGVIAYEMAWQLVRVGERVDLLALLEAALPGALERPGLRAQQRRGRLKQALADATRDVRAPWRRAWLMSGTIARKSTDALLWEISNRAQQWWVKWRYCLLCEVLKCEIEWPERVPELTVHQICDCAEMRYQPKPLKIPHLVLVRAQRGEGGDDTPYQEIYADDAFGWRAVAENITLVDVDGGHSTLLRERFVDSLAAALMPDLSRRSEPAFEKPAGSATETTWENLLFDRQEV
jgi:amino acid adenylation domain-containing protein